ncbi:hypothetical protein [Tsukamurella spumae]|uniref:DUF3987 domain-containing protein n=1 Tax=Tsukamurella spumae TaxID=44753 RepID=A0A846X3R4_9ACTN|nr:hypothetical protein [Tsukamurella spumae]
MADGNPERNIDLSTQVNSAPSASASGSLKKAAPRKKSAPKATNGTQPEDTTTAAAASAPAVDPTTGKISIDTSLPGKLVAGGVSPVGDWGDPSKKLLDKDGKPDPFSQVSAPPTYSAWGSLTRPLRPCQTTEVGEKHVAAMQALTGKAREQLMQQVFPPVVPTIPEVGPTPSLPPHRADWSDALDPQREWDFFSATPFLRAIRNWARANSINPWSAFAAAMEAILGHVGPHVVIPQIVGGKLGSLNTVVVFVAHPGGGKGTVFEIRVRLGGTEEPIGAPVIDTPGSGAAVPEAFASPETTELGEKRMLIRNASAILRYNEITQFADIVTRKGDTMDAELLKSYSAEGHGSRVKNSPCWTQDHETRSGFAINCQPEAGQSVTGDINAATGKVQRTLYMPAEFISDEPTEEELAAVKADLYGHENPDDDDLSAYDDPEFERVSEPFTVYLHPLFGTTRYNAAGYVAGEQDFHLIKVHKAVRDLIKQMRRVRGWDAEFDARDTHAALTRLKVAVALTVMHGGYLVTVRWWNLAGLVMQTSNAGRTIAYNGASKAKRNEARAEGETSAERRDAEAEKLKELKAERLALLRKKTLDRALQWVKAKPVKHPLGWTITEMCTSLNSFMNPKGTTPKTTAEDVRACVDSLVEEGKLTLIPDSRFDIKGNAVPTFLPTVAIGAGAA